MIITDHGVITAYSGYIYKSLYFFAAFVFLSRRVCQPVKRPGTGIRAVPGVHISVQKSAQQAVKAGDETTPMSLIISNSCM